MQINVKDFTTAPGPAWVKDGPFSGELFREEVLRPKFNELYEEVRKNPDSETRLNIDFDGAYGYSFGWLEEVFGGMILYNSLPEVEVFCKYVTICSQYEPYMEKTVQKITDETYNFVVKEEKKLQTQQAKIKEKQETTEKQN